jgi:hypothetical protein
LSGVKDIYKYFGSSEDLGCDASGEPYIYRKGNKKFTHHRFVTEVLEIIRLLRECWITSKSCLQPPLSSGLWSMKA